MKLRIDRRTWTAACLGGIATVVAQQGCADGSSAELVSQFADGDGGGPAPHDPTDASVTPLLDAGDLESGSGCTPKTCAELGTDCGPVADGCGGLLDCGTCTFPDLCGGGGVPSVCGGNKCVPKTCADVGATCGPAGDGCGGLLQCGACSAPETCGGGGVPSACGAPDAGVCIPKTCADVGANCGPVADGCGGIVQCGTCTGWYTCGGGGVPSVCGAPDAAACVPRTCADAGATCGPIGDGCGGQLDCGTCTPPQTCGGGGVASVCGGSAACVPRTCADLGVGCGPAGDGCGGQLDCGACTAPQTCGGGGVSGVCGGTVCVPRTCAQAGANCGPIGDGCGGVLQCGTCTAPSICGGGGVPSVCGGADAGAACTGLCLQQTACDAGKTTTVSGTVFTPAAAGDPLYGALVYVPNAPLEPFADRVTCDQCGDEASGSPLVQTTSGPDGKFVLQNVPVGTNIPLVIQLGRWRKVLTIPTVSACVDNALPSAMTHLPSKQGTGGSFDNIPRMAMVTGNVDALECVLRKIGIDDSQFSDPGGSGRVQLFVGLGNGVTPRSNPKGGAKYSSSTPTEAQLWNSATTLEGYDMVLLACQGAEIAASSVGQANLATYARDGGRIFATHFSYSWLYKNSAFDTTADWSDVNQSNPPDPLTGLVDLTNPKGPAFASWLQTVGASSAQNQIQIQAARHDIASGGVNASLAQQWIYSTSPSTVQHYTFNTPVGAPSEQQCGRVLFSDFHVADANTSGSTFPSECAAGPLTAQEKVLEFMLFDLASCIVPSTPPPPPTCTPTSCAAQGISCGPAGDGCGNLLDCGTCVAPETCGGGGVPGVCGGTVCHPRSCADQGIQCGPAGDGCGVQLDCGTCAPPQTCGGGGTPGVCGAPTCTKLTCAGLGYDCGPAGDGCGGVMSCGVCTPPATCGGGGRPGVCGVGDAGCTRITCASQNVECGAAGDGCGGQLDCGGCPPPDTCGGGGVPGHCGHPCDPTTCSAQGIECGPAGDGCGGLLNCGPCPTGQTCGGGGVPGKCGAPACTPTTCAKLGFNCGPAGDGCGGQLDCGTCAAPLTCGGGGQAGVCGGVH